MSSEPFPARRLRVVLVEEGGGEEPKRLWDELPALAGPTGLELIAASVFAPGPMAAQWESSGIPGEWLGVRRARDYSAGALRLVARSRAVRADVIAGVGPIAGFLTALAGRLGASGLAAFHRQGESFDEHPRLADLSRWAGRLAPVTVACSESTARYAVAVDHTRADRVRVAYNGANRPRSVAAGEVTQLREELGIAEGADVIVAVSRLRPEKGLDSLLRALPDVAARTGRPVVAVIAGDGIERERLTRLAAAVSGPRVAVRFPGVIRDVALWFTLGDIATIPSRREPFGVAAVEAMLCGRPVVAGRVGGLCEVVLDGQTGVLVDPGDPGGLAAAYASLLQDPAASAAMGRAARQRAEEQFTNAAMVAGWRRAWLSASAPR